MDAESSRGEDLENTQSAVGQSPKSSKKRTSEIEKEFYPVKNKLVRV